MKIDYLGEYDEYAIPHEFQAPLNLAERDNAIACANGKILGTYGFVNESVLLAHAKRRAEFAVMLANGEIIVDHGKVLRRVASQNQEGRIVVTYAPIGYREEPEPEKTAETPLPSRSGGLVGRVKEAVTRAVDRSYAKAAVKKRGRPKKK